MRRITEILAIVAIFATVFFFVTCGFVVSERCGRPRPLTNQDLEIRLLNLEKLHSVTIDNHLLTLEHVSEPTSCSTVYVKVPMDKWLEYEHLFGR